MANWDVTLDGVGYMIAPGSYRATGRRQAASSGAPRRTSHHLDEFAGGLVDQERSDLFDVEANGAWPAPWPLGSAAIGAAPRRAQVSGTLDTSEPKLTAVGGGHLFIAAGDQLYRWAGSGSVTHRLNLAANSVDITRRGEDLFVAYGTSADVQRWHDSSSTSTLSVLGSGEQATHLGAAGEMLVTAPPATPDRVEVWNSSLSSTTTILLGGNVRRIANGGDGLLIATDREIAAIRGTRYISFEVERIAGVSAVVQSEDDFAWLAVYQGRVVAWVGGQVMALDSSRNVWEPLGLRGESSSGAAVVDGWLLVAVQIDGAGSEGLWAYDGLGWWPLHEPDRYPAASGAGRLVSFEAGLSAMFSYDLGSLNDDGNLVGEFSVTTRAIPVQSAELTETLWTAIGVDLVRPDGQPVGEWDVELAYSTDGGVTWIVAGTSPVNGPASLQEEIDVTASSLRVRVTAQQMSGLPPLVGRIHAVSARDGEVTTAELARRWSFTVTARDGAVDRDGTLDPRDGQTIRAALWALYEAGDPVTFRDVDYDATSTERQVRIVEVDEEWPRPYDQSNVGAQTALRLTLEEVST